MDPTILAALIGAVATIAAAFIGLSSGRKKGYEEGYAEGQKHSLEKFMDEYLRNVTEALEHINNDRITEARGTAKGLVENVMVWRGIQRSFSELLNGLITELDEFLKGDDISKVREILISIKSGYEGRRLAIETELKRSRI
ncbi:MAG: hypothetical protein P8098_15800 [Candidatus Thiodiazotropha sp.]